MKLCLQKNESVDSCEDIEIDCGYVSMHGIDGTYPCIRFCRKFDGTITKYEEIKLSDYYMVHIL